MSNTTAEKTKDDILKIIYNLSPQEIQYLIKNLFIQKLYTPPELKDISAEGQKVIKLRKLPKKTIKEAIKWARSQKS
ncbi:MAG: hypothetical protein WC614_01955 [bacterium]